MEVVSKQLALTGRLKPEARLGLAISDFVQSLDSDRKREFQCIQTSKSTQISSRDVIKVTEEINQEGARRHQRSWRPHGTRVGGFLSRIQTLASIGDVLIGGSQNIIATSVWSAVRLSLTIATNYLNYFEKLSTLFMRLGTSWALHEDFAQLFPRSAILQTLFCEYLIVLIRLCHKVVIFGQKRTGAQFLSTLGSSFESEFGPIQKELDQWGYLIQEQSQLQAMKIATGAENSRVHNLKQQILWRLSPYQSDFESRWRRQRKKGTCEWIFDNTSFTNWKSMKKSATLCISGKLGSGKTVSMANIVARMDLEQPCAHAFCASQEPNSLKAASVLGSFAFNLLDHLPTESIDWREAEQYSVLISTFDSESVLDLVLDLLPEDRTYVVIADGLEDCPDADIADVISGLCRLIQERTVLLCYSSRSDSRFHHVAKQRLAPDYKISLDDFNHDAEIEAYIVQEVTRRNSKRHLSSDLEELVKKQLIIGAQGMYLWASLQLDTIFPADSNVIVTDEHILNLITHLPKDLPDAFEQALNRIPDRQFEGRIMKLVMSAVTPLSLDEIRVALCMVIGEPIWHPERVARDGTQLISLCGGSLLDLDEEDGNVRFIHHSVIQHLLSPAASPSTIPYHFTVEDAENFIGATCVTYLNLPVLDSRMAMTRNISGPGMLDNVIESTEYESSLPGVRRLVHHIRSREKKRGRPSQFDIGHLFSQIHATRIHQALDPGCLFHYAARNWVLHTKAFDDKIQSCEESWKLWWRLLNGEVAAVEPPCEDHRANPSKALLWAIKHAHGSIFRNILARHGLLHRQMAEVMRALELHNSIRGQWLGDILAKYLHTLQPNDLSSMARRINFLLEAGADPTAPHSLLQYSPIEIVINRICADSFSPEDEKKFIHSFFSHPALKIHSEDRSMYIALGKLLERSKTMAFADILTLSQNTLTFSRDDFFGQLLALQHFGETSDFEFYAIKSIMNSKVPSSRIPTLSWRAIEISWRAIEISWRAIETENIRRVSRFLQAGKDPNIGPFKLRVKIKNPSFLSECYPLEGALWLRRTGMCLELLHHKADVGRLGEPPMRIAEKTRNRIMMSRLYETSGCLEQREQSGHRPRYQHDCTALLTACKMFLHHGEDEPLGFPRPLYAPGFTYEWRWELENIIHILLRDANAEYVNAQDADEKTALHYLVEADLEADQKLDSLVRFLLRLGADPNLPDRHGATPFCHAIQRSAPIDSIIKPLLEAGAEPSSANLSHGFTILHQAMIVYKGTEQDVIRLVRLLLQAGADPRDPVTPTSTDPDLMASVTRRGIATLVQDLKIYTDRLNQPRSEGEIDLEWKT